MALINMVKERIVELGLKQKWVADQAGVHETYLTEIVKLRANPSIDVVLRLAKVLHCKVEDIFQLEE